MQLAQLIQKESYNINKPKMPIQEDVLMEIFKSGLEYSAEDIQNELDIYNKEVPECFKVHMIMTSIRRALTMLCKKKLIIEVGKKLGMYGVNITTYNIAKVKFF